MTHAIAGGANTFSPIKGWLPATGLEVVLLPVYRHCRQCFSRIPPSSVYHHPLFHRGWRPSKRHIFGFVQTSVVHYYYYTSSPSSRCNLSVNTFPLFKSPEGIL